MRRLLLAAALAFLPCYALAQGITNPTYSPSWNVYLAVSQTGLTSATRVPILFDTAATAGGNSAGICDLTVNVGRCTPNKAGVWLVGCSASITSGGIVASNSNIALVTIRFNGATTIRADFDTVAPLATLGSIGAPAGGTALFTFNGTTDYVDCTGYSDGAGDAVAISAGLSRTRFYGTFIRP